MLIIGADYHPSFQQIAFFSEETGECGEQRLSHDDGEAERFYRDLQQRGMSVRIASAGLYRGAILAASINVVCKCLLRCFDSGVRCTVLPELFSAPHSPQ